MGSWQEFVQLQSSQTLSEDDEPPVGLSDEEELKRAGQFYTDGQGIGEVLVDYSEEFADLGLTNE